MYGVKAVVATSAKQINWIGSTIANVLYSLTSAGAITAYFGWSVAIHKDGAMIVILFEIC